MKSILFTLFVIVILLSHIDVTAEPYKGKVFPSDQQLAKTITKLQKSIGKRRNSDGSYELYILHGHGAIYRVYIVRLDSGIWIYDFWGKHIVQK